MRTAALRIYNGLPVGAPKMIPLTVSNLLAYGHFPKVLLKNQASYTFWMLSLSRRGFGG